MNLFLKRVKLLTGLIFSVLCNAFLQGNYRNVKSFDEQLSFKKDNNASDPEKTSYDASNWHKVNFPHDWSIELPIASSDHFQKYRLLF